MTTETVLAPELEQALRQPPRGMPRAEHLEPFLTGAREVLEAELGAAVGRGALRLEAGSHTTQDVTAIVGITGQLTGLAVYGMSRETGPAVVGRFMGAPVRDLGDLTLAGNAEVGDAITARAGTDHAERGTHAGD